MLPLVLSFFVLSLIGMPIALSLGVSTLIYILMTDASIITTIMERIVMGADSFLFVAIPLFIMAANVMNECGITERIFTFARSIVGGISGGLAYANVLANLIFSGFSGSAVADAGALGKISIKSMSDQGYPRNFAAAVTSSAATIGPIFPPSIPLVVYGGIAEVSVGKLFVGGAIPGTLIACCLMILIYVISIRKHYPYDDRFKWSKMVKELWRSLLALMTPVIILSGIIFGYFTPTEAAAITVFYALKLGIVYRTLRWSMIPKI
ncbi:MAG: TRAP transporter large permease, partial [Candidatus Asgardarchaeum sp.]